MIYSNKIAIGKCHNATITRILELFWGVIFGIENDSQPTYRNICRLSLLGRSGSFGATVIKFEPQGGDYWRSAAPAFFHHLNRGKRVQALPSDLAAKVINNNFKGKKKTAGAKGGAKKKAPAATETTAAAAEAKGSKGTKKKTKTTTKGKKKGAAAAVEEEAAAKTEAAAAPLKNTAAEVQAMADRSLAAELINGKFKAIALEKEVADIDWLDFDKGVNGTYTETLDFP